MKKIEESGVFKTRHEGHSVSVMFKEDYARLKGVSKYGISKMIANNYLHQLKIAGRERMDSVIVLDMPKHKLFKKSNIIRC